MSGIRFNDDLLLDALLDRSAEGDISSAVDGTILIAKHAAFDKLSRLQHAFAQLHQTPPTNPTLDEHLRFHWRHLAVLDRLGAGGYGEVFRAYDSVLEREVALKLRRANHQFSPAAGRAFIDEARRLARVRHPNVLAVHGAAVDQGRAGIWTDLLIGETLATRIARDGPLPYAVLLALCTELSAALAAVHEQAIVHGDLKPANIMCEAGKNGAFVLMDFGAGALLDEQGETRLNAGTLNFMAPEQLAGGALGTAADLYALGACLYFAATATVLAKPDAVGRLELSKLRARSDVAKDYTRLIASMLAAKASARPSAAASLAQCQLLIDAPKRRRRQRLQVALTMILIAAVLIELSALGLSLRARAAAETEAKRAVATKEFLLGMMRNSNPYQSPNPTRSVATFFESAITQLPAAFAGDPRTEALLLSQFGRTLAILEHDESALQALWQGDHILASTGVALSENSRIVLRGQIIGVYRTRREYAKALGLATEQAGLCAAPSTVSAKVCVWIVNNQIVASEPIRPLPQTLSLVKQNLARVVAAKLENDEQAIGVYSLQALFLRELGQAPNVLAAGLKQVDRSLRKAESTDRKLSAPDLLTALTTLAFSADDFGDALLARELNRYALAANESLFGKDSQKMHRIYLQAATFALHDGDYPAAAAHLLILRNLAPSSANATWIEQATMLAALAGDVGITDAELLRVEHNRHAALGDTFRALAQFRLGLAAIAIKRGQMPRAKQLLAQAQPVIVAQRADALLALYWQLAADLAHVTLDVQGALAAEQQVNALLRQQHRKLFDPVQGVWIGPPLADKAQNIAAIRAAAARIYAAHKKSGVGG